ncbi:hypothetical protein EBO15_27505 [Actinomadura harenae]|uniref:Uncharacterized protein n=1 Tax=Actinomadura harenae TaxID=2483351 RepID=A0A3M2LRM4_9ACTN|nr:hypothetical protein EBO15_27505 [Actinomadura harenae]
MITSGALVAGVAGTALPAGATTSADGFGVEATTVQQGSVTGAAAQKMARGKGQMVLPQTMKAAGGAVHATSCRWVERTRGRKTSRGRWIIYVKTRLTWCYDGLHVNSARVNRSAYTYNKRTWRLKGWRQHSLTHDSTWASVLAKSQYTFYYTGNGRYYRPYADVMGSFNGGYHVWAGG